MIPTTELADCERDPVGLQTFHFHHLWQPLSKQSEVLATAGPAAEGKAKPKAHTNGNPQVLTQG